MSAMKRFAEKVAEWREVLVMFPRCVKCNGDMTGERLKNLIPVVGRDRRLMHATCPRGEAQSDAA